MHVPTLNEAFFWQYGGECSRSISLLGYALVQYLEVLARALFINAQKNQYPVRIRSNMVRYHGEINVLERRENDLENIMNELNVCKELLKKETSLKNEASEQTCTIHRLLCLKTQELTESKSECFKLQEKNMAVAKELAELKLVSNLDLDEDEIDKLVSLGIERHSNYGVDILKKCLVARNRLYTELIKKFNALTYKESRSCKELEKAKEQLEKLKLKKKKDNEVLRAQVSKKTKNPSSVLNGVDPTLDDTCTPQDIIKEPDVYLGQTKRLRVSENINESSNKDDDVTQPTKSATTDASNLSKNVHGTSEHDGVPQEDATNRHPSKLCKQGQSKAASGVAVGPDGRGGTIKVFESHNLTSLNSGGSLNSAKIGKIKAKASSLQSRGYRVYGLSRTIHGSQGSCCWKR
ncbi:hypothetical protein M8C21_003987 [Ambrosia artemisiifolia]|uniref:Uncharacterized protein n=1 Tax=Ambrosia artemisiifolia TaxID=4212 RepID=A0AAD5CGS0_AMBAR|nr:hypothetical protein M8C21_003987 [Ambrosia artemisiifolia]